MSGSQLSPLKQLTRVVIATLPLILGLLGPGAAQPQPGPAGPEEGALRRQRWLLPSPQRGVLMRTTVYRPRGAGPFPLVVISHGSSVHAALRAQSKSEGFEPLAAWFTGRGFAVAIPQRPGHGDTGGEYMEDFGSCAFPTYDEAAEGAAASIHAAVQFMLAQSFVQRGPVVLVGHSAGALGSLTLAASRPELVRAVIDFAGGQGGRLNGVANSLCAPDRLVASVGGLGRSVRVPTLWIYAENDTYFGPELSRRMAEAFRQSGGPVSYHLVRAVEPDGHFLVHSPKGVAIWGPLVETFLRSPRGDRR